MAFTRVKPGNWAVNEKLTSAQMNSLDIDHANALDKTSAGDTISGTVNVTGAGKVVAATHDSIISVTDSGISVAVGNGISINHATGLTLEGSIWPAFRSNRSYPKVLPLRPQSGVVGWTVSATRLLGPATTDQALFDLAPHHGSTLTTVEIYMSVGSSHSAVPAVMPGVRVRRDTNGDPAGIGIAPTGFDDLYSGGQAFFPTPATGVLWYAGGVRQKWTITCDQNNVIDTTKYRYFVSLIDENGSNSIAGNNYYCMRVTYTAIPNMQFA